jgi:transcriptional regulator GlxA family with amidase domain
MQYMQLLRTWRTVVQQIGFVVFPGFQVMGFTAVTAFEMANMEIDKAVYEITLLSEDGGLVRSSAGFNVETEAFSDVASTPSSSARAPRSGQPHQGSPSSCGKR